MFNIVTFYDVHETMFISTIYLQTYKAFLPAMMDNNHGHLVSISSSAGLIGVNGLAGNASVCTAQAVKGLASPSAALVFFPGACQMGSMFGNNTRLNMHTADFSYRYAGKGNYLYI